MVPTAWATGRMELLWLLGLAGASEMPQGKMLQVLCPRPQVVELLTIPVWLQ